MFTLSKVQKQALDSLTWLHSCREDCARSGRTYVLALHILRTIVDNNNEWVTLVDHYKKITGTLALLHSIFGIAKELEIDEYLEVVRGRDIAIRLLPAKICEEKLKEMRDALYIFNCEEKNKVDVK